MTVLALAAAPAPLDVTRVEAPTVAVVADSDVHFGGPDRPAGALRDLLEARIRQTPPGGEIDWATYYLRDVGLAQALIDAHRRGVRVRVSLERRPLQRDANDEVAAMLRAELGKDLRLRRPAFGLPPTGHLHAKIYGFDSPSPSVFVGSFNPSGSGDEEAEEEGPGDQDKGYNLLVELRDPVLVKALRRQAVRAGKAGWPLRLTLRQNRRVVSGDTALYFYPRLRPGVVERSLEGLGAGDRVEGAVSHISMGQLVRRLQSAARAGARVSLVFHATERRAPSKVLAALGKAGVEVSRYSDPEGLPMHAKALIVERDGERTAWFGSFNYNHTSRWLNREVLVRTTDPDIVGPLASRVREIRRAAADKVAPALSLR